MSDGSKDDRPRRAQSQTERDEQSPGLKARKTPPQTLAVPEFVDEVDTGVMSVQERNDYYEELSDRQRIRRLEKHVNTMKADSASTKADVAVIKTDVAVLKTETAGQTRFLERIEKTVNRIETREDTVFEIKGEIHKATEIAKTEVTKNEQIAKTEIAKTEQVTAIEDKADAKKLSRKAWATVIGGAVAGVELLHQLVSYIR